ncbi:MAG: ISAzo13 family transposase, partial [Bryobacterales bacterium]|nr:ISAzo13 family transposase [Bryobacterales bacterium]
AVDNLDAWWRCEGNSRYPEASQLILLADCGGSNSYRIRAWKYALQHRFCNLHRLPVTVAHYPAGCSKWNPIEHRLFSEISRNWSGCPLESFELILNYIACTTTRTGLAVTSRLNSKQYPTGIQISDEQMEALNITRNQHIPKWNYTISPFPN